MLCVTVRVYGKIRVGGQVGHGPGVRYGGQMSRVLDVQGVNGPRFSPGCRTRHRLSLLFHDGGSSRGNAENAGLENAGLENTGTSCVWVAKCNIINVRGHVRVNVTAGRGGPAYTAGGNSKRQLKLTRSNSAVRSPRNYHIPSGLFLPKIIKVTVF